jgi:hypothetical protein
MEVKAFRGNPNSSVFKLWLEDLTRDCRAAIVIVAEDISCSEAREIIRKSQNISPRYLNWHPWLVEGTRKAMLHLATCQQSENCKRLLQRLVQKDS